MLRKIVKRCWGMLGLLLMLALFCSFQGTTALMLIVAASFLHETAHLLVLWALGGRVSFLSASSNGLQICADSLGISYFRESMAVLAGPVVNIAAGVCLSALSSSWPDLTAAAGANWVLGLFNLLPAAPLDGWRFLQLLLYWRLGPVGGARAAALCGGICGAFLSAGLLLLMIYSGGNLWLLPTAVAVAAAGMRVFREEL